MKNLTVLVGLAMVCMTVIFVSMQQPVRAARVSVNLGGATFTDLPLVNSHSFAVNLDTPLETSPFTNLTVRALESQMPPDAGLLLTHVSSRNPNTNEGDYYIFIDGGMVFAGGQQYGGQTLMLQPMSPILIRPGRLLRIEFRAQSSPVLVSLQGYAVPNPALFP